MGKHISQEKFIKIKQKINLTRDKFTTTALWKLIIPIEPEK